MSSLALLVRRMAPSEVALIVKAWKMELLDLARPANRDDWWALCNHAIDRIVLPSSEVLVGCAPSEPATPLCWVVIRRLPGLSTYETLYRGCRRALPTEDPELAASLERALVSAVEAERVFVADRRPLNLYQELKRP